MQHRPALVSLTVLAAVSMGAACDGPRREEAPFRATHLVPAPVAVTIGNETRLVDGPATTQVLKKVYPSAAALPRELALPDELGDAAWVLLVYRAWQVGAGEHGAAPRVAEGAEVLAVRRTDAGAGVAPAGLDRVVATLSPGGASGPVQIEIGAAPLTRGPRAIRSRLVVPSGAELAVGYGLLPHAGDAQASGVRFRVLVEPPGEGPHALLERVVDPPAARWFDESLDLGDFAGREIALELRLEPAAGTDAFALGMWSDPVVHVPAREEARPNVILVSLDTLRAQSLGTYGYGRDTAPFLDQLARDGTLFEHAIAPAATTGPSHMSLFTGLYPPQHGLVTGMSWKSPAVETLAALLRSRGYHTAAFTENGFLIRDRGFTEGFATYTENTGDSGRIMAAEGEATLTFSQARGWLERNRRVPFFLFVHTYEVHFPYRPPEDYATAFADDELPGQPERPMLRQWRTDYDREIRVVDDELRRLFATIREQRLEGSTIVIILSDHGEEFGEHGGWQHGATVYEELLRVPLVFWGPGRIPAGRRHAGQVSLIDVAPTVLDLVDAEVPEAMAGKSLAPTITADAPIAERHIFAEARARHRWMPTTVASQEPPVVAVRSKAQKYVVHRPATGEAMPTVAFDLATDPEEQRPRIVEGKELEDIHGVVDDYLRGTRESGYGETEAEEGLSPELRERLRELGYIH
jgi:arylsulfatase A-like enzyme